MDPEKRPSSPDPFTASLPFTYDDLSVPPAAKSRRLNSHATPAGLRKAVEMNRVWVNYIENVLEEEDFSEALLAMESMIGRLHIPIRAHIRQLLALSLSPSSCLRTVKTGDRKTSKMAAPSLDPLPATERKIRHLALRVLENVASTLSGDAIFRAIKSHGVDELLVPPPRVVLDKHGKPVEDDEDDDEGLDEQDTPLMLAGKRLIEYEDVWALLGGGSVKAAMVVRNAEQPMAPGAWELLRTLVGVWEGEVKKREEAGKLAASPSLMQSLKANTAGVREVSSKVLDIVAWPFRSTNSLVLFDSDEEEEDHEEEVGSKGPSVDNDDLTIAEKQAVAMRLLALFAQGMAAGRLDSSSLLHETTLKMKGLSSSAFVSFLELLPRTLPSFTIRLISYYLESHSLSPLTPPSGSPSASPSRRCTLGPNGSITSSQTPNGAGAEKYPLPSSSQILSLLSKLPSDFPLPPTASTSLSIDLTARRAPSSKPRSFNRISQSCEAHSLLKQALLEALWTALDAEGREREREKMEEVLMVEGEAEKVLREVEGQVEKARARIEGPKPLVID